MAARCLYFHQERLAFEATRVSYEVTRKPEFSLVGEPTSLPARGEPASCCLQVGHGAFTQSAQPLALQWIGVTRKPEFSLAGNLPGGLLGNLPAAAYKLAMGQVCLQGQSPTVAPPVHRCCHLSPNTSALKPQP